jgi:hypothetical protein
MAVEEGNAREEQTTLPSLRAASISAASCAKAAEAAQLKA